MLFRFFVVEFNITAFQTQILVLEALKKQTNVEYFRQTDQCLKKKRNATESLYLDLLTLITYSHLNMRNYLLSELRVPASIGPFTAKVTIKLLPNIST